MSNSSESKDLSLPYVGVPPPPRHDGINLIPAAAAASDPASDPASVAAAVAAANSMAVPIGMFMNMAHVPPR